MTWLGFQPNVAVVMFINNNKNLKTNKLNNIQLEMPWLDDKMKDLRIWDTSAQIQPSLITQGNTTGKMNREGASREGMTAGRGRKDVTLPLAQ